MRYPATEKLEIIRIVERSHLPAKLTLDRLGIARRTFYRWYDRYLEGGPEALVDQPSAPSRVWNRIPAEVQDQIIELALEQSELSPRELAVRFTDEQRYFVSEATVYRLLKAHDLITSPAYVVIKAADRFHTQTTRPNEMWQTDFTYFKIIGWGWVYCQLALDMIDAAPSPRGAQKFPRAASWRINLSSVRSEIARRSRPFSFSRSFSRRAWSVFRPPYSLRQR
jgi:putative transposase